MRASKICRSLLHQANCLVGFDCCVFVKVNELKAQLNDVMRSKQGQSTNGLSGQNFNVQRVMTPSFHDEKHKQMLRKIEKNKKEEYEVEFIKTVLNRSLQNTCHNYSQGEGEKGYNF